VKGNSRLVLKIVNFTLLLIVITFNSCSWLSGSRSVVGGRGDSSNVQTVPKAQYDVLLSKYEKLLNEGRDAGGKEATVEAASTQGQNAEAVSPEVSKEKAELIETVNLFDEKNSAPKELDSRVKNDEFNSGAYQDGVVENQILELRKATALVDQNKVDQAIAKLKTLEESVVPQVKVVSKFLIGELLFKQGEYDLSMQIFE